MIEQKARGSVWSVAMLAVFLFLGAISVAGVFSSKEITTVSASATN